MKTYCHFLEDNLPGLSPICTAGVNFASVGSSRECCRVCPFSDQGNLPLCPNLDVYTFLSKDSTGAQVIDAQFECFAEPTAPIDERCPSCPQLMVIETRTSDIFSYHPFHEPTTSHRPDRPLHFLDHPLFTGAGLAISELKKRLGS